MSCIGFASWETQQMVPCVHQQTYQAVTNPLCLGNHNQGVELHTWTHFIVLSGHKGCCSFLLEAAMGGNTQRGSSEGATTEVTTACGDSGKRGDVEAAARRQHSEQRQIGQRVVVAEGRGILTIYEHTARYIYYRKPI